MLKCPECEKTYPWLKLFSQFKHPVICPYCRTKLSLSQKSAVAIGLILALFFVGAVILAQGRVYLSIPLIFYLILPLFIFGRFLVLVLGNFKKLSK